MKKECQTKSPSADKFCGLGTNETKTVVEAKSHLTIALGRDETVVWYKVHVILSMG